MKEIKHLWNVTKYLMNFDGETANSMRMFYTQKCKQTSTQLDDLPKTHFGPTVMCSHCSSLWKKNQFKVRIQPGQACSKSVKRLIKNSQNNSTSRFRDTLIKKSLKNSLNKVVVTCLVCSGKTLTSCKKPKRCKPIVKKTGVDSLNVSGCVPLSQKKKKKKKKKDKTAGLIIPNSLTPTVDNKKVTSVKSTSETKVKHNQRQLTPLQKVKRMNLDKLSNILNESKKKSKSNINNFLKQLY